ncbi:MAG: UDP-N-acetylmuramoyl-L-alanyl-D-glutamate--2,6-diaminopimelate ligase [Clostridia bacterium]|nr:UDP-N-acetylmuramoyl-L-alanyl-D-glutamate--2,6-diaminopimelate ligase [Clostridia bacterium]
MTLHSLLKEIGIECDFPDCEVASVTDRIENVRSGSVFVCIHGRNYDGHLFGEEALQKGASAIICERPVTEEKCVVLRNTRVAYSFLCSAFFEHPGDKLKIIGITGTNGKTTTAYYLRHFLESAGYKCAVLGTLGCDNNENIVTTGYTTPSCDILFESLYGMVKDKCEYCIMEVSSQALAQNRVDALSFELGIVTNIGSEHLDYHGSIERYVRDKCRLVTLSKKMLLNNDDAYIDSFLSVCSSKKCLMYSAKANFSDFMAKNIRVSSSGISYILLTQKGIANISCAALGEFSVYNTLAAAAAAYVCGVELADIEKNSPSLPAIKGRFQIIKNERCNVCIDFAHTPQALMNVLQTLRKIFTGKIITVFGCGGNRDKSKRPEMGAAAALLSDCVIITSDNPRNEDEQDIIDDILSGIKKRASNVFCEKNREKAIELAVNKAKAEDVILIAGKGHEEYQIKGNEQIFFSDEKCVRNMLN